MKNYKKLRYGGVAVALTALIIAVIVLFNVVFTALTQKYMWYLDMTQNAIYSLTEECITAVRDGIDKINAQRTEENEKNGVTEGQEGYQKPATVNIYFCADPDMLMGNSAQRYVYETALSLADEFDFINIEYLNWRYNPSTVEKYKATGTTINSYSVIVDADNYYTAGTKWMAYSQAKFFASDESGNTIGYNGERVLASAILSTCSADTPIAYVPINHSEAFYDDSLLDTISYAGYKIVECDLSDKNFEFSDQGRILLIYNPRSDFSTYEIERMEEFLSDANSMMVFMDPTSPKLQNLEEYLETWGILFDRTVSSDGKVLSAAVNDKQYSLTSDGYTVKAEYVTSGGLGNQIYSGMLKNGYAPSVIFPNAMPIKFSENYIEKRYEHESDYKLDYTYGYANLDGSERYIYDVFTAPWGASTILTDGTTVEGSKTKTHKLMTISARAGSLSDGTGQSDPHTSYVLCCGSLEFAKQDYLESAVYGNPSVLTSVTTIIGRETVPASGVDFKYFKSYEMSDITDAEANQYTLLLSILPPVIVFGVGAAVLIRRRYS